MHKLSINILLLFYTSVVFSQSPHGESLVTDCAACHNSSSWQIDIDTFHFNHDTLDFVLQGTHTLVDCKSCHSTLIFNEAPNQCISCHDDMHSMSVGADCARCHNSDNWLVDNIPELHEENGFPLIGNHSNLNCIECHISESGNRFDRIGNDCVNCHLDDFNNTKEPDHKNGDYSMDCLECHDVESMGWGTDKVNHDFFPLILGHDIKDCKKCHITENYSDASSECISCHQSDFDNSSNPNHPNLNIAKDCALCHTTNPSWKPANFDIHDNYYPLNGAHANISNECASCHNGDYNNTPNTCVGCHLDDYNTSKDPDHIKSQFSTDCITCHNETSWKPSTFDHDAKYFPIYSGEHEGEWNSCLDCHTNPSDYGEFSCTNCHINPETDDEHKNVSGYVYEDMACLACHPTGDADYIFDHNATNFPLTGAHIDAACIECHANGYEGTPTNCIDCHKPDYDGSLNPDHNKLNLPTDCAACHTTDPEWKPAAFDIHDDYYILEGAHISISNDCVLCHNGDYNNTPNTCVGCHIEDYNEAKDPDHVKAQFSKECIDCHSQDSWTPSTFDHDGKFFPIYSGKHQGEWSECIDCHSTPGDYSIFTCIKCHTNPETDDEHKGVGGYEYNDLACLACHPTGDADYIFDHASTTFPLTGAHITTECSECHSGGYRGTPSNCNDCHQLDFDGTINPNHTQLNFSTDCATCHTTEPTWKPATFDNHDDFYLLEGAHISIAMDCNICHNGDYNNTPNTCIGCHKDDYDQATNPNHAKAQFSTDCTTCHTQSEWTPSTFDHDGQYFPIYSGKHEGEWSNCVECHINPNNIAEFSCITCHTNPETDDEHKTVNGYIYNDDACLGCHPTGDADMTFDHDATNFPLTGTHISTDCFECHVNGGFEGLTAECVDCHQKDYDGSTNPNHSQLNLSTDCATCHTTEPSWNPARFDNHDDYYELKGAHINIAMDCAICHQGDYNNTPNECIGCHQEDYNNTSNPNHVQAQFSTDCTTCHNESSWIPSSFDHDDEYFPIYSGSHEGEWSDCIDCHTDINNYSIFTCVTCHMKMETDEDHEMVGGYVYESIDCLACHPTGEADEGINHDDTSFPLTGGHIGVDCKECHEDKKYEGTPTDCYACHKEDYNSSTNPNHTKLNLSMDCLTCHTTDADWKPATFDIHDNYYELTGAHIPISNECNLCHHGDYNTTPTDCKGCHQNDYDGSTNPNHVNLGLSTDCDNCHTTMADWKPATFDIHDNYYPLTGAHEPIANDCDECHHGNYNNTPNTCVGCHQDDYDGSTNPNHLAINIPTTCKDCHTTAPGWKPATFDIHDNYYPLTGAHEIIANDCNNCHNGDYNNTPNTCVACHQDDYDGSTNPNHINLNLSTNCEDCHTTNPDWKPATFDNHDDYYMLNGAHTLIANDCDACHNGDYNNTPNTCVGCHQDDYDNSTNPNHSAAGYPTDCEDCHTEDAWVPSTFDHDGQYFPIYTGKHHEAWDLCADCHFNPNDFSVFSCIDCHEHDNQSEVDDDHNGVGGYMYESNACYSCHPDGEE